MGTYSNGGDCVASFPIEDFPAALAFLVGSFWGWVTVKYQFNHTASMVANIVTYAALDFAIEGSVHNVVYNVAVCLAYHRFVYRIGSDKKAEEVQNGRVVERKDSEPEHPKDG